MAFCITNSVTRRTREIGIRIALGAAQPSIRAMVLREMLWILGIGLAVGIPAALAVSKFTEGQLYGVKAFGALVLGGAAAALTITAAMAAHIPARRVSGIDLLYATRRRDPAVPGPRKHRSGDCPWRDPPVHRQR